MKRLILGLAAFAALTAGITSCSDNSEPAVEVYQTIATFDGNIDGIAQFSYQAIDDSPLITLRARNYVVPIDTAAGQYPGVRVFITYRLAGITQPGKSGEVEVIAAAKVYQDTVSSANLNPENFTEPYVVETLTRSGKYLNLFTTVPEVGFRNRSFTIVADAGTLNDDYPQLYLCMSTKPDAVATFDTRAIGSFFIAPVWNLTTAKGVDVHVSADANSTNTVFRFTK